MFSKNDRLVQCVKGVAVASVSLLLTVGAVQAQELSGSASGGGAIQGGSGAPGGGVGLPGAITNNTTAAGIGEDDTLSNRALAPQLTADRQDDGQARAYYPIENLKGSHHRSKVRHHSQVE